MDKKIVKNAVRQSQGLHRRLPTALAFAVQNF